MTTDEYRAEAERLRGLSASPTVTHEDFRHYLDLAAIFDTLANADEAMARSAAILYTRTIDRRGAGDQEWGSGTHDKAR